MAMEKQRRRQWREGPISNLAAFCRVRDPLESCLPHSPSAPHTQAQGTLTWDRLLGLWRHFLSCP